MIVFNFLVMKSILIPLQDIKFDFYHVNYKVGEGGSCHTSPIGADPFFFFQTIIHVRMYVLFQYIFLVET